MCNIAGYNGTKPAAPILIDMMMREEGFGGGYYSGLATIHKGQIHYAKLTGGMDRLVSLTKASTLPGNIGIIHSRSKSGGGDAWAHPFIGKDDQTAYVANGAPGIFKNSLKSAVIAAQLIKDGYDLSSRDDKPIGTYPQLLDGSCVHMSDIMCGLITKYMDSGMNGAQAMTRSFQEIPSEIVGLLLSIKEPELITVARINMPMTLGFSGDGAYLSTAAIAFPSHVKHITLLPVNTASLIKQNSFTCIPFSSPPSQVDQITPFIWKSAYQLIEQKLSEGKPLSISGMCSLCKPFFTIGTPNQSAMIVYEVLRCMNDQKKIRIQSIVVPGASDELTAVRFYVEPQSGQIH